MLVAVESTLLFAQATPKAVRFFVVIELNQEQKKKDISMIFVGVFMPQIIAKNSYKITVLLVFYSLNIMIVASKI